PRRRRRGGAGARGAGGDEDGERAARRRGRGRRRRPCGTGRRRREERAADGDRLSGPRRPPPMSPSPDGLVLVTGATGFLGATLVRRLVDAGVPVRILRRASSSLDLLGDAAGAVAHAEGDVTDWAAVRAAVEGVAQVYHAAAFVGFGGRKDRETLM